MHVWERGELGPQGPLPQWLYNEYCNSAEKSANANIREHSSLDQAYS